MHLAQDNDVVQALTPDRSAQLFGEAIFCHGEAGAMGLSQMPMARNRRGASFHRNVSVIWRATHFRGRMGCDVDPDEVSAVNPDDDKGVQQVEAKGRNHEQVHGGNIWRRLHRKARHPWLGGSRRLTMYRENRRLIEGRVLSELADYDLKPRLDQLWRSPEAV